MTVRKSISILAARLFVCVFVAVGLTLVGCTSETIESSPTNRAAQKEMLEKDVNQAAKSKTGKSKGPPIVGRSIKSKVLGAAKD